jgi:hypothetical protein
MRPQKVYLPAVLVIVLGVAALTGCSHESADWKAASAADTAAAYQQFLQQHPNSADAAQAKARVKQLADDRDWQAAAATDTRDAYQQFVAAHADSKWAQEARIRIENFAQGGTSGTVSGAATLGAGAGAAVASKAAQPSAAVHSPGKASPATAVRTKRVAAANAAGTHRDHAAHYVQLGAFRSKARAQQEWKLLSGRYPTQLKSMKPRYVQATSRHGPVYRLQVAVDSSSGARDLCARLKKHARLCLPVSA